MFKNSEYTVVSFSCLLTDCTNVMDTRFQIVKVPTAWLGKDTVLATSFMERTAAYVAWNFGVLAEGAASPMAHKIQDQSIKGAVAHSFSNTLNGWSSGFTIPLSPGMDTTWSRILCMSRLQA